MLRQYIAAACVALVLPVTARAAVLDWSLTSDNAFALYVSPSDTTAGTLIFSNLDGPAGQWSTAFSGSVNLPNGIQYINIVGYNYTISNGLWTSPGTPNGNGGNPNAIIGSFTLSGGTFADGANSLLTGNSTDWTAIPVPAPSPDSPTIAPNPPWQTPNGPVNVYGANGVSPWGTVAGLPTDADWIWSNPDNGAYADFSAQVLSRTNSLGTPLPAALPLFATGLGALGLLGWRKKRKNTAAMKMA